MHLGIFSYNVAYGARPDELARAAEERGFESFWVGEHTHIPAARQTPYPGGEPLPKPYYHMADPFVSLMAAAAATRTIKLGTGICLVVEHDPIVLAKAVATLDWLKEEGSEDGAGPRARVTLPHRSGVAWRDDELTGARRPADSSDVLLPESTTECVASSRSSCWMPVIAVTFSNGTPPVSLVTGVVIGAAVAKPSVGIFMTPRLVFDISRNSLPFFL